MAGRIQGLHKRYGRFHNGHYTADRYYWYTYIIVIFIQFNKHEIEAAFDLTNFRRCIFTIITMVVR